MVSLRHLGVDRFQFFSGVVTQNGARVTFFWAQNGRESRHFAMFAYVTLKLFVT